MSAFDEPEDTPGASSNLTPATENRTLDENEKEKKKEGKEISQDDITAMTFIQFTNYLERLQQEGRRITNNERSRKVEIPVTQEQKRQLTQLMRERPELFNRPPPERKGEEKPPPIILIRPTTPPPSTKPLLQVKVTYAPTEDVTIIKGIQGLWGRIFYFRPDSLLHSYLVRKLPAFFSKDRTDYSLELVLRALTKIIKDEILYDPQNPMIIMCDLDLEIALNRRAFHVSDFVEIVAAQFFPLEDRVEGSSKVTRTELKAGAISDPDGFLLPMWASKTANAVVARAHKLQTVFDIESSYYVKPAFLKVLRMVEGVDQTQIIFKYKDITNLLSQYITARKDELFDLRNISVALVENDPLGYAFGVRAFARSQVHSLFCSQLVFLNEDEHIKARAGIKRTASSEEDPEIKRSSCWVDIHKDFKIPRFNHPFEAETEEDQKQPPTGSTEMKEEEQDIATLASPSCTISIEDETKPPSSSHPFIITIPSHIPNQAEVTKHVETLIQTVPNFSEHLEKLQAEASPSSTKTNCTPVKDSGALEKELKRLVDSLPPSLGTPHSSQKNQQQKDEAENSHQEDKTSSGATPLPDADTPNFEKKLDSLIQDFPEIFRYPYTTSTSSTNFSPQEEKKENEPMESEDIPSSSNTPLVHLNSGASGDLKERYIEELVLYNCIGTDKIKIEINLKERDLTESDVNEVIAKHHQREALRSTTNVHIESCKTGLTKTHVREKIKSEDTLRFKNEITKALSSDLFDEEAAKITLMWILIFKLGELHEDKIKNKEETSQIMSRGIIKTLSWKTIGDIIGRFPDVMRLSKALNEKYLDKKATALFETIVTQLPLLEELMKILSFNELIEEAEKLIKTLQEQRFIGRYEKRKFWHEVYIILVGVARLSVDIHYLGLTGRPLSSWAISPASLFNNQAEERFKTLVPDSKLPSRIIIKTKITLQRKSTQDEIIEKFIKDLEDADLAEKPESTQEPETAQLSAHPQNSNQQEEKEELEEDDNVSLSTNSSLPAPLSIIATDLNKQTYESLSDLDRLIDQKYQERKIEEELHGLVPVECSFCKQTHPLPQCTEEGCGISMCFTDDSSLNPMGVTRQVCAICNKRHVEGLAHRNKISLIMDAACKDTYRFVSSPDPWSDNPRQEVPCTNSQCSGVFYIPLGIDFKKRGIPATTDVCQKCHDRARQANKMETSLENRTYEEIKDFFSKEETICFIPPPSGIHYTPHGDRKTENGLYLPEDHIKVGFKPPNWEEEELEMRPVVVPPMNLSRTSDLYRDISKYHFLNRCVFNKKCVHPGRDALEMTDLCAQHLNVDHTFGRHDTVKNQKEKDNLLYQSEEFNLQHFSYFLEPPEQSNYVNHSTILSDDLRYDMSSMARLHINYGKMPSSRNELEKLGFCVKLLGAQHVNTELQHDIQLYIARYLKLKTMGSGNRDMWIGRPTHHHPRRYTRNHQDRIYSHTYSYKPEIHTKFISLSGYRWNVPGLDAENQALANPADGHLRDSEGKPLPDWAKRYWSDDHICYVFPPFAVHYDEEGSRLRDKHGIYAPQKQIQLALQAPDWETCFKDKKPVLSLPSYSTKISKTSDLYRDLSYYHKISRCVVKKMCTKIQSVLGGSSFEITLEGCRHGYSLNSPLNNSWSDDQTSDFRFVNSENHNFKVFGSVLYPPLRSHYTNTGGRKEEHGDYFPMPEVNYECTLQHGPEFVTSISPPFEKTQMEHDFVSYISMKTALYYDRFSALVHWPAEHAFRTFGLKIQNPSHSQYDNKGNRKTGVYGPFKYTIIQEGKVLNPSPIDPEFFFSHKGRTFYRTLMQTDYSAPIEPEFKGAHPNKNSGHSEQLLQQLVGNNRSIIIRPDLLVLNVQTEKEAQLEEYLKAKTDLSIFGAFIPPPLRYTYNEKGEKKAGFRSYSTKIRINYCSANINQLNTVSYKQSLTLQPGSTLYYDVEAYLEASQELLKYGCEVIRPPVPFETKRKIKIITLPREEPPYYRPTLQLTKHSEDCLLLRQVWNTEVTPPTTLGTMHPNQTYRPDTSVDLADPEQANSIRLQRPALYKPTTNNQKEQAIYNEERRDLSILGSYVTPPEKTNYDNNSQRLGPYTPKIVLNNFHLPENYMTTHFYREEEEDPNHHGANSSKDLQNDIRLYKNILDLFMVLGSQVLPPACVLSDDNGITPSSDALLGAFPKHPDYVPHLRLRPTAEIKEIEKMRILQFDTNYNPWDLTSNIGVDPAVLQRAYSRAHVIARDREKLEIQKRFSERASRPLQNQYRYPSRNFNRSPQKSQERPRPRFSGNPEESSESDDTPNEQENDNDSESESETEPDSTGQATDEDTDEEIPQQVPAIKTSTQALLVSGEIPIEKEKEKEQLKPCKKKKKGNKINVKYPFIGSPHPNQSPVFKHTRSGIDINRVDKMKPPVQQNQPNFRSRRPFFKTKEPKIVLTPRQKYLLKCVDSQTKLTIFGAYITPPSEKNYTSEGERVNKKYKPALKINTKSYTRESFGDAYHFSIPFEDSISNTSTSSDLFKDYDTYQKKVHKLLESGCEILRPSKAMDVLSKASREHADWEHLKVKLVFGITLKGNDPCDTTTGMKASDSVTPAYFTPFSKHPNQLKLHRQRKGDTKPNPLTTPNKRKNFSQQKDMNQYMKKAIKTRQQQKDVTIFGSYVHPPCKQTHQNSGYWFSDIQINYNCFRVSDFASTHFLNEKSVDTFVAQRPEDSSVKRFFEIYTTAVRRLIQQGNDPSGNPLFLPNICWRHLPHFADEIFREDGDNFPAQLTAITS